MHCITLLVAAAAAGVAHAQVSIYPVNPVQIPGVYTGYPAYDPTVLQEPAPFNPTPPLQFTLSLTTAPANLSRQIAGSLFGFSIEMSIADVVIGSSKDIIWPQFLNLMEILKERGGPPVLRVGGNSQEKAQLLSSLPDGKAIVKFNSGPTGVTNTPTVLFTTGILEAMSTVTNLLGIKWFMGIPMNQTQPARLDVVGAAVSIIGDDNILGWQLGNEPDLYSLHGFRPDNYEPADYINDYTTILAQWDADSSIPNKKKIGGPSICCLWDDEDVLTLNYLPTFADHLSTYLIEHYPTDNCNKSAHDPNEELLAYLSHSAPIQTFTTKYAPVVAAADAANLPTVLLETNTASCNGFLGISDAFASALWAVDLALQLGLIGVQHIMFHMGGQGVYYNPFVPPPFNATAPYEWTAGPIFYSAMLVAEALGPSGTAQLIDTQANENNDYTPAYAIYENGAPVRVVLINYQSGGDQFAYTASISVGAQPGGTEATPQSVQVRYMLAPSVTSKVENITYNGQSLGVDFNVDGILRGADATQTVPCANGLCPINVPAPGVALVFLAPSGIPLPGQGGATETFATTYSTQRHSTATIAQAVLESSNGISGKQRLQGSSTSFGDDNAAVRPAASAWLAAVVCFCATLMSALWWE